VCWTGLIVEDDGGTAVWAECRLCGYATALDLADGATDDIAPDETADDLDGGDAW
jgi:hypothetical protein